MQTPKNKFIWKLYYTFSILIFCFFCITIFLISNFIEQTYLEKARQDLLAKALLVEDIILYTVFIHPAEVNYAKINTLCLDLGQKAKIHLTFVLPTGEVVGDSENNIYSMDNYTNNPEIITAFKGELVSNLDLSSPGHLDTLYIAQPVKQADKIVGVLKVSTPLTPLNLFITRFQLIYTFITSGVLVFALLVCIWFVKKIKLPLAELSQGINRLSQGQFYPPLNIPKIHELAQLTVSINQMAFSLQNRINSLMRQKSQEEIIFSSMGEGVIAIDVTKRVLSINNTAAQFLQIGAETAKGRRIEEILYYRSFLQFINKAILACSHLEEEIIIYEKNERYFDVQANPLIDADGQSFGSLIVIRDTTQLRRLENVRKDFAANVSHELKTPLTSIKGFVETLINGAINEPEEAKRFLAIIAKQTERIIAIVEDLMSLARLEQYEARGEILKKNVPIFFFLQSAIKACEERAAKKEIQIQLFCDSSIRSKVNAHLLEQAVINLIDNAIKYSNNQQNILVSCQKEAGELTISVEDNGIGIAEEHLPRLFERFYRVDKARSSHLGGTGLGLAIVKHIAQAHGGKVSVQSRIGQGSTFTIHLPLTI